MQEPKPSDKEMLADLRRVFHSQGNTDRDTYEEHGAYPRNIVARHFGGWADAVAEALKTDKVLDPLQRSAKEAKDAQLRREHAELVKLLERERETNKALTSLSANYLPPKVLKREKGHGGKREMTAVAMGSDWHVDEIVEKEKVAGVNEHNLEIAEKRMRRFFEGIISLVEGHRASGKVLIRDLVLAFSGDLTSGHIHEELVETTEMAPLETMLWLQPRLRDWIKTVLETLQLESIVIPWSYGNHGRYYKKPRIATGAEHNFEWALGRQLQMEFAHEKRIRWDTNPSPHQYSQVYDFTQHWHHGDSVTYKGGVGGLSIPLLKRVPKWNKVRRATWHYIGHYHTLGVHAGGEAISNGSSIGYSPFSFSIGADIEPPQQAFHLIDSKRGLCQWTPIWVGENP